MESYNEYLSANRPVYIKDDKCIWWHKEYRHWWFGPCENVGGNAGHAYIEEDVSCPFLTDVNKPIRGTNETLELTFRRGGSDEIITGVKIHLYTELYSGFAVSTSTEDLSGAAGLTFTIQNLRYKQKCKFSYRNGNLKCL
jgi:hypothetical protein